MENKNKYTWDLESILENETLDSLYDRWVKTQEEMVNLYKTFYTSYDHFKNWILLNEQFEIIDNRLSNYITNNYQVALNESKWVAWMQKIQQKENEFNIIFSDYSNIILKNATKIQEYLNHDDLKIYQRIFDKILKTKNHVLSDKEELLLTKTSIINAGFDEIFTNLTDNDLKFPDVYDQNHKKISIKTQADVFVLLKSPDQVLRKNVWLAFNQTFNQYTNTLTQTLYYNYLMLNTYAKLRNFKDYVNATCFSDEIEESFILHIYEMFAQYKDVYQAYLKHSKKLLKKLLNLKKLEPWDLSVDLYKKPIKYTIEQAKTLVLAALKPMGEHYLSIVNKAFNEQWIDFLPKPNKQTGAYSIGGTKGLKKYFINMNFDQTLRSVYTLIHELGHSMHSYYFNQSQKVYVGCSIFYAEVSSIVNEVLLSLYLLDHTKNDPEMQKMILDELLSNFFATTSRQIIFSNFEYIANQYVNEAKPFTSESLKQLYVEMIDKYQGLKPKTKKRLLTKDPYMYGTSTIFRIDHFYVGNFYVYKYAIGQVVAFLVANEIYHNNQEMIKKYENFLRSGKSLSPLETIKLLDIDLTKNEPFMKVQAIINDLVKKFKKTK